MSGALVTERRLGPLRAARCWAPLSPDDVEPLLSSYHVVTVSHAPESVGEAFRRLAFCDRPDLTTLVDLRLPLDELQARLHGKCAYKIRRAERDEHEIFVNERAGDARTLLEDAIERKRWRPPIADGEWERTRATCDVFLATLDGRPAVAHVVLRIAPRRVLLEASATLPQGAGAEGRRIACLNRLLHWSEFEHYRERGFETYDFGGVVLDPAHGMYGIARFKRSFGGDLVVERFLRLALNPGLRALLRRAYRRDARSPSMNAAAALAGAPPATERTARA